ncbi:hypothetical protein EDC01DRAFT_781370 [Geopyxis carbonaria]|nr:hypothetical protein EDC01DRAFT_781370 [Geopyxis carbonaria]
MSPSLWTRTTRATAWLRVEASYHASVLARALPLPRKRVVCSLCGRCWWWTLGHFLENVLVKQKRYVCDTCLKGYPRGWDSLEDRGGTGCGVPYEEEEEEDGDEGLLRDGDEGIFGDEDWGYEGYGKYGGYGDGRTGAYGSLI